MALIQILVHITALSNERIALKDSTMILFKSAITRAHSF